MQTFMTWLPLIMIVVNVVAVIVLNRGDEESYGAKEFFFFLVFVLSAATFWFTPVTHQGIPLDSITAGSYTIVGMVEVSKDKQPYY